MLFSVLGFAKNADVKFDNDFNTNQMSNSNLVAKCTVVLLLFDDSGNVIDRTVVVMDNVADMHNCNQELADSLWDTVYGD